MIATIAMTAGSVFLMWIGEQIDAYGIGNGISLLIMAGIIARMPDAGVQLLAPAFKSGIRLGTETGIDRFILLAALFVTVVIWVVAITEGQRRIPIQSAKHVRGRRVMGGQRQSLPLRVNQAGVMPIMFASSILVFPMFVFKQLAVLFNPDSWVGRFTAELSDAFNTGRGYVYNTSYILLIYVFCYFWVAVTFNPKDISENLKDYGSFIPGYRPGAPDGPIPGTGDDANHVPGGRFPGDGGRDSDVDRALDGHPLHGGELLRRHGALDRRLGRPRRRAEDRQPPHHAELSGVARIGFLS